MKDELIGAQTKITVLNKELQTATLNFQKELLATKFSFESFKSAEGSKSNDEKICFYTGLPNWEILSKLFTYLEQHLPGTSRNILSPFQQVMLTLMRLRLNLSGQDLGYRFGIHKSTVSRTFNQVLTIMYYCLRGFIYWPDRDELQKTMPMDFRKYCPRCAVIIDCFEIFVERPSNLKSRMQTYSSYKHHNTVKYLIGITPQGTVSFISDG